MWSSLKVQNMTQIFPPFQSMEFRQCPGKSDSWNPVLSINKWNCCLSYVVYLNKSHRNSLNGETGQYSLIIGILTTLLETLNVYACCICLQFGSLKALQGQEYFLSVLFNPKIFRKRVQRRNIVFRRVYLYRENF